MEGGGGRRFTVTVLGQITTSKCASLSLPASGAADEIIQEEQQLDVEQSSDRGRRAYIVVWGVLNIRCYQLDCVL